MSDLPSTNDNPLNLQEHLNVLYGQMNQQSAQIAALLIEVRSIKEEAAQDRLLRATPPIIVTPATSTRSGRPDSPTYAQATRPERVEKSEKLDGPPAFSGLKPELLPSFLFLLNNKLKANRDRYPTEDVRTQVNWALCDLGHVTIIFVDLTRARAAPP
jgi:hypothetical protein